MVVRRLPDHPAIGGENEDLGVVVVVGDRRDRDPAAVGRPGRTLDILDPSGCDVASTRPVRRGYEEAAEKRVVAAEWPEVQQLSVPRVRRGARDRRGEGDQRYGKQPAAKHEALIPGCTALEASSRPR
jgi:hypothetical protein